MRIGILTDTRISPYYQRVLQPVLDYDPFEVVLGLIDGRPKKTLLQKIRKNWKRGRGGYMFVMAVQSLAMNTEKNRDAHKLFTELGVPFMETADPYNEETTQFVTSKEPDVLFLLGGFGIIKKPLLEATSLGMLSYHHGDIRKYRGMPPAFWELYNDEKKMGVTLQRLSPRLDKGLPLAEIQVPVYPTDTVNKLTQRAYAQSEGMLFAALQKLDKGSVDKKEVEEFGQLYTLPNLRHWLTLQYRVLGRKLRHAFSYSD